MMRPCLVTDELSADPETAFELGREWGVVDYELRGYFSDRVPMVSPYQKDRLKRMVADFGARISSISPGLFKIPYPAAEGARSNLGWMDRAFFTQWEAGQNALAYHQNELLPASIDFAGEFGARFIIAFGFHRGGLPGSAAPSCVIEALAEAAERVHRAGLTLLIETEEGFWADTGRRSADMIASVGHPGIGINWDPANAFCEGDTPYPDGYRALRGLIGNVHFKDARRLPDGTYEFVLDGDVDWAGQIKALAEDGYDGLVTIEPHLAPRVASVRASLDRLMAFIRASAERPKAKALNGDGSRGKETQP